MSHSINFQGFVGIGIKELNKIEYEYYCHKNKTNFTLVKLDTQNKTEFRSKLATRVILSGCYYVDPATGLYSSYGMEVLESTNLSFTQCTSNHLTQFAGGFITLPSGINFSDVFANASFLQNITIYMTVIVIGLLYSLLFIWTRYMDKKDELKMQIHLLPDNENDDIYFYEILFFTGLSLNAGTESNVIYSFYINYRCDDHNGRSIDLNSTIKSSIKFYIQNYYFILKHMIHLSFFCQKLFLHLVSIF